MKIIITEKQLEKINIENEGCRVINGGDSFTIFGCSSSEAKQALSTMNNDVEILFLTKNDFVDLSEVTPDKFPKLNTIHLNKCETNFEEVFPSDLYEKDQYGSIIEYDIMSELNFDKKVFKLNEFFNLVKNSRRNKLISISWDGKSGNFYFNLDYKRYILKVK